MRPIDAGRLAEWAGGELRGDAAASVGPDVVIDSRLVTHGSVFVAIGGERVDGHDYVADVLAAGAGAALVSRRVDTGGNQIVVDDTIAALSSLARGVVSDAAAGGLVVVGITGSSGKTSTKDLIAQVFADAGPTVAPPGSFNNEIGLPLTACRVDADTRYLVAEMGARGIGHISWLCSITPPAIGAVLNVGTAHLGEFGGVDGIAQAKGELVEALPATGWAVLNADDPRVVAMASRTQAQLALFAVGAEPRDAALRVWASDVTADHLQRHAFTLNAAGATSGRAGVQLTVMGEHQVPNALAAAAIALAAGLGVDAVAASLSAATARSRWRMELAERADGLAVLNDSYNANPDSMTAALRALSRMRRPGGRLVAVLGDMLELGEDAPAEHEAIGALASESGVDELIAVGAFARDLARGYGTDRPSGNFEDRESATVAALAAVGPADVVLVKASRGLALNHVADALLANEGVDR